MLQFKLKKKSNSKVVDICVYLQTVTVWNNLEIYPRNIDNIKDRQQSIVACLPCALSSGLAI